MTGDNGWAVDRGILWVGDLGLIGRGDDITARQHGISPVHTIIYSTCTIGNSVHSSDFPLPKKRQCNEDDTVDSWDKTRDTLILSLHGTTSMPIDRACAITLLHNPCRLNPESRSSECLILAIS